MQVQLNFCSSPSETKVLKARDEYTLLDLTAERRHVFRQQAAPHMASHLLPHQLPCSPRLLKAPVRLSAFISAPNVSFIVIVTKSSLPLKIGVAAEELHNFFQMLCYAWTGRWRLFFQLCSPQGHLGSQEQHLDVACGKRTGMECVLDHLNKEGSCCV